MGALYPICTTTATSHVSQECHGVVSFDQRAATAEIDNGDDNLS
jgi:hypothetical protein